MQSGGMAVYEGKQCLFPCDVTIKSTSSFIQINSCNLPYTFCEQIGKEIKDISDEIPFEIPESWEWCRLSDIVIKDIKRGKSPVYADNGSVLVFAQKCNVKSGGINISLAKYLSDNALAKYPQEEYMQNNDIIINSTGTGTLGRIGFYINAYNQHHMPLVPDSHITIIRAGSKLSKFIYYVLKWYQPILEKSGDGSTKQKELKATRIKALFIPLPPLAEQKRIVEKIEQLLPFIEKYEQAETQLTTLNTSFPEMLKKSILQEAVQGKLVPQNPNDEPASVLLERIRAEKQKLIKAGKIKKSKHESVIITRDKIPYELIDGKERCIADEIPFEIPESWEWCRFGNAMINRDSERIPLSVAKRENLDKIYDYYGASGVIDKVDKYLFNKPLLLIGEDGANLLLRSKPIAFIARGEYWVNNHAHALDTVGGLSMEYICVYINAINLSPYVTGTAQPKMNQEKMNSILVPIPPLAEQKRIVEKIEELIPMINSMSK